MHHKHFFLENSIAKPRDFTPRTLKVQKQQLHRNRLQHATYIKQAYDIAIDGALDVLSTREKQGRPIANGVYVNFDMIADHMPQSFSLKDGVAVMKLSNHSDNRNVDVTLYIQKDKTNWLSKKANEYADLENNTPSGKPKHASLIEPINSITQADILNLYTSADEFEQLPENRLQTFELWLTKNQDYSFENVKNILHTLHITVENTYLEFEGVTILLISATKHQLVELPYAIGYIEGIRPYMQPSVLVQSHEGSREWSNLIGNEIQPNLTLTCSIVGLLDSGVNNAHKLIAPVLPNSRMVSVISAPSLYDRSNHGTDMAGLILYGDFTNLIYQHKSIKNACQLASVKLYDGQYKTEKEFYGAIIENAVRQAYKMGATIQCMAVTDDVSIDGRSTSSSAALDESIYNGGKCDCLVIVSAGNIETSDIDSTDYLASCKANAIKSPAQAWNALTVGAYTEKTIVADTRFRALAAPGGISPMSRSSWCWNNVFHKPEIVMEGGNVANHPILKTTTYKDLSLITTSSNLTESLETFHATSAATALATRLAAKIKTANPELSALSIRGLMVHSAEWTEEMRRIGKSEEIMSLCGYGVPNEEIALYSNDKYATYIFENELIPFSQNNNTSNSYNQLHFYDMPWPSDELVQMGKETVTIKITLSYYIEPSPSNACRMSKYRYPSATLHFDLKDKNETIDEFLRRKNKKEGEKSTNKNHSKGWALKGQQRLQGTVQSNWMTLTATELAACGQIVVYPGPGWWKERKLQNVDNLIKYSLIVSIKTTQSEIYSAVATAISNKLGISVAL